MKKLISVLAALSLLLLAGCGSSVNPQAKKYYNAGIDALSENNYTDAIANFTEALEISPTYADAYLYRGDAYVMAAEETAKLADADSLTVYSIFTNANIDYSNALKYKNNYADFVNDKLCHAYRTKCESFPSHIYSRFLELSPEPNTNIISPIGVGYYPFCEVAYSSGKYDYPHSLQPIQLYLTFSGVVSEAPSNLLSTKDWNVINEYSTEDFDKLSAWLDTHTNYKCFNIKTTTSTEWTPPSDDCDNLNYDIHFGYIDPLTNLSVNFSDEPSWATYTLNINGQNIDFLLITHESAAQRKDNISYKTSISYTMLVPIEYDLGTFYIGVDYCNSSFEDEEISGFHSIPKFNQDIEINFLEFINSIEYLY